jgi:hypothetical protein
MTDLFIDFLLEIENLLDIFRSETVYALAMGPRLAVWVVHAADAQVFLGDDLGQLAGLGGLPSWSDFGLSLVIEIGLDVVFMVDVEVSCKLIILPVVHIILILRTQPLDIELDLFKPICIATEQHLLPGLFLISDLNCLKFLGCLMMRSRPERLNRILLRLDCGVNRLENCIRQILVFGVGVVFIVLALF